MPDTASEKRESGSCVTWHMNSCYGFVRPDLGGSDLFVHQSDLPGLRFLSPGDRISYVPIENRRHPGKFKCRGIRMENDK